MSEFAGIVEAAEATSRWFKETYGFTTEEYLELAFAGNAPELVPLQEKADAKLQLLVAQRNGFGGIRIEPELKDQLGQNLFKRLCFAIFTVQREIAGGNNGPKSEVLGLSMSLDEAKSLSRPFSGPYPGPRVRIKISQANGLATVRNVGPADHLVLRRPGNALAPVLAFTTDFVIEADGAITRRAALLVLMEVV